MNFRFSYIILFLSFSTRFFCQDVITKNDSTKILAKILEVNQNEIKYKQYDYIDGPLFSVSKNDLVYIIYQNGTTERIFYSSETQPTDSFPSYKYNTSINRTAIITKTITSSPEKIADYIQLNIHVGIVVNEAYINKPYVDHPNYGHYTDDEDFTIKTKSLKTGINAGINFLFGKSTFCKHIIGVNYLQSKSEFHHSYYANDYFEGSHMIKSSTHTDADYKTTIYFINVITGVRFIAFKKISIDNCIAINIPHITNNLLNGTITQNNYQEAYGNYGVHAPKLISSEVTILNDKKTLDSKVKTTFSFSPKISYECNIKKQKIGIYISCNLSYKYALTWYMAGLTYYPFKKLR